MRLNRVHGYKTLIVFAAPVFFKEYVAHSGNVMVLPGFPHESLPNYTLLDQLLEAKKKANTPIAKELAEKNLDGVQGYLSYCAQHLKNNTSTKLAYAKCVIPFVTYGATVLAEYMGKERLKKVYASSIASNALKVIRGMVRGNINAQLVYFLSRKYEEKADSGILKNESVLNGYKAYLEKLHTYWRDKMYNDLGDPGEWVFDNSALGTALLERYYDQKHPSMISRIAKVNAFIENLKAPKPAAS